MNAMTPFKEIGKKAVTGVMALTIALTATYAPITPYSVPRAHAYWGILDTNITDVISFVLDGLAWAVAKAAVNAMTESVVNWINSGFEGSPAFATNLNRNLRQLGDATAARFMNELINNSTITSPQLQQIVGTVAAGYLLYTSRDRLAARLEYTLDRHLTNPEAWVRGDFNQGGFDAWMATTFRCGNDRYCSEFAAQEELINRLDSELQSRIAQIGYGNGFLSWECGCSNEVEAGEGGEGESTELSDADASGGECNVCTPGTVIESQLEHQLGSGVRQLELADSINEIVGALAVQLVKQALGGEGGLIGASAPSEGGGRSFLERVSDESDEQIADTLSTGFRETIELDRTRAVTLRDAAQEAVTVCEGPLGDDAEAEAAAKAALERANNAIAALDALLARIAAAEDLTGAQQSAAATSLSNDYSRLLSSGRLPSASDVDTDPDIDPPSTVEEMNEIVADRCS